MVCNIQLILQMLGVSICAFIIAVVLETIIRKIIKWFNYRRHL